MHEQSISPHIAAQKKRPGSGPKSVAGAFGMRQRHG